MLRRKKICRDFLSRTGCYGDISVGCAEPLFRYFTSSFKGALERLCTSLIKFRQVSDNAGGKKDSATRAVEQGEFRQRNSIGTGARRRAHRLTAGTRTLPRKHWKAAQGFPKVRERDYGTVERRSLRYKSKKKRRKEIYFRYSLQLLFLSSV